MNSVRIYKDTMLNMLSNTVVDVKLRCLSTNIFMISMSSIFAKDHFQLQCVAVGEVGMGSTHALTRTIGSHRQGDHMSGASYSAQVLKIEVNV